MQATSKHADFEKLYVSSYSKMKRFAKKYLHTEEDSENVVHDVFTDLWDNWETFSSHNNLSAFLFLSVKNKCIDFIRRKVVSRKIEKKLSEEYRILLTMSYHSLEAFNDSLLTQDQVESAINNALNSLPTRCREIFVKNKLEGKKQKDIAEELGLSVNTVENQVAIAYKKLREELKDLLPLLFFLFFLIILQISLVDNVGVFVILITT